MAIEQMKLLSITGKDSELESFLLNDLIDCNIQIEDAKKIYDKGWKFEYYEYDYRVKDALKKCTNLLNKFEIKYSEENIQKIGSSKLEEFDSTLDEINNKYEEALKNIELAKKKNEEISQYLEPIKRLECLDIETKKLYDCKYLKFRYGNVPNENIEELKREVEDLDAVFFEVEKTEDLTWIIYFTTEEFVGTVDSFFNMQGFERLKLPEALQNKPTEYVIKTNLEISENELKIKIEQENIEKLKKDSEEVLINIYEKLKLLDKINNLKKYIVKDQNNTFYIVVWVPESNMNDMVNMLNKLQKIDFVVKDAKKNMQAPTKLKNWKIFKPFEEIVKMYGMPNSMELDPTPFIAIVTCLMFGIMFGDVGQGAVILILGLLVFLKNKAFGSILFSGGLSSIIFGFLYGSVFGKEDILKPILISPMENITTMLISGIVVGSVFILLSMILNIINGIKNGDIKKAIFDGNGLVGFIMYGLLLIVVGMYFLKGVLIIPIKTIIIVSVILLLLILFSEKIEKIITLKKKNSSTPFVEKAFDLIEMLLSFLSNTISFLRLAAFAINHTGLCMAMYLLADMTTGVANIAIAIIGNIIVIVLEGLIVGIQVLRLEYYELFSRFYDGNGREYKSIQSQSNK